MTRRAKALVAASCALLAAAGVVQTPASAEQASQPSAPVAGLLDAGRYHSCAVVPPGHLRCWGYGGDGSLGYASRRTIGDDETPAAAGPVDFGAGRTVTAVSAGRVHSCAVLDGGHVSCWGFAGDGRLGYGNEIDIGDDETPAAAGRVDVGAGRTAKAISAGAAHSCALLDDYSVRCWGFNFDGRLGYGHVDRIGDTETPGSQAPVNLGTGRTARAITAGDSHTCALLDDGHVRCWGLGSSGQLGYGSAGSVGNDETPDLIGPVDLGPGRTAVAIAAGDFHTCVVLDDGNVRCWGFGGSGRLGYGNTTTIGDTESPASVGPVDLGPGRTAKAITAGDHHTCALLDDGSMRCWGFGDGGRLGYASNASVGATDTPAAVGPVDLGVGRTAVAIAAGGEHTCARLDDDSVRCWGRGPNGELGHCSTEAIGDGETPGSIDPIDLGVPGVPAGECRFAPPPPPPPPPPPAPGPPVLPVTPVAPPAPDPLAAALRRQSERAAGLRACRATAARRARGERNRARRISRRAPARARALRAAVRRAADERRACLTRFARTPGRVTSLSARASTTANAIVLSFNAVGTDGSRPPAARGYLVRQSLRPIRTPRDFARAATLCDGICRLDVTQPGASLTLNVTSLRRRTTYYYAVAARDNVTGVPGPRSRTVKIRTR